MGGAVGHRFRFGGGLGQALPKAAGFKRGNIPSIIDATAGLGRDAFLLASLGAQVTLVERSIEIHDALRQAMYTARESAPELIAVIARMTLIFGDSREILPGLKPDVVLVDPMHPPRKNSALVKNEMRLLRQVVGSDSDALDLMRVALGSASNRVVLKWPLRAPSIDGLPAPSHQIIGKTLRYDVFMTARQA